jgi:hypothetical protein
MTYRDATQEFLRYIHKLTGDILEGRQRIGAEQVAISIIENPAFCPAEPTTGPFLLRVELSTGLAFGWDISEVLFNFVVTHPLQVIAMMRAVAIEQILVPGRQDEKPN